MRGNRKPNEREDDEQSAPPDLGELAKEQRRQEAAMERLADDQRLFDRLVELNFEGMLYNRFEEQIVMYAMATVRAWLCTGEIFSRVEKKTGWSLHRTESDLRRLRMDSHLRDSIVGDCVTSALRVFREKALFGQRWTSRGGASLTTFFMGAILFTFSNTWRAFQPEIRAGEQEVARSEHIERAVGLHRAHGLTNAEPLKDEEWNRLLGHLKDPLRAIVQLHLEGYSHVEIVALTGIGESAADPERVIEGRLYRWKKSERKRRVRRVGGAKHA